MLQNAVSKVKARTESYGGRHRKCPNQAGEEKSVHLTILEKLAGYLTLNALTGPGLQNLSQSKENFPVLISRF
jgi:hypothetical protein